MTEAYETDTLPGKILEGIQMQKGLQEITIAECIEDGEWRTYRENLYIPDDDELHLHIIQEYHDPALAGHPGQA